MLGFIRSILEVLKMKKFLPYAVAGVAGAAVCAGAGVAAGLSASRRRTIASIKKLAGYPDGYGLYSMDVRYGYDLDAIIASNTQWSIVYNPETLTAQIAIRRHWGDAFHYSLERG